MVNFNGEILEENASLLSPNNRGFLFGDVLFEEIRMVQGKLVYWEDHYFRLMASMRIMRMEIPMAFTMEFLEAKILATVNASHLNTATLVVRLTVFREGGLALSPNNNEVAYLISATALTDAFYILNEGGYEAALFKDYFVNQDMLSQLGNNNKGVGVVASIYAQENGYDDCILLNTAKQVVGTVHGALFMVKGQHVKTPPLSAGVQNTVIRKKILEILGALEDFEVEEANISPFDLQKADELFVVNITAGIQPVLKYRKKTYAFKVAKELLAKLNASARLASLG